MGWGVWWQLYGVGMDLLGRLLHARVVWLSYTFLRLSESIWEDLDSLAPFLRCLDYVLFLQHPEELTAVKEIADKVYQQQ